MPSPAKLFFALLIPLPRGGLILTVSCSTKGRSRSSRTRGRMRWTRQRQARGFSAAGLVSLYKGAGERRNRTLTTALQADGEGVNPDAPWHQGLMESPTRPGRETLSRCRWQRITAREQRDKPLKPLRAERRVVSGVTVVTNSYAFSKTACEAAGASAPGVPHALFLQEGGTFTGTARAHRAARARRRVRSVAV